MTIELRAFASGDTDYISKLNQNYSIIKQAIDALQTAMSAVTGSGGTTPGLFLGALFGGQDALIGPLAYKPTLSGTTAVVDPGSMYLRDTQTIVTKGLQTSVGFSGQPAGTYYIVIDSLGNPIRDNTLKPGTAYQVEWSGSSFVGDPIRVAGAFFDTAESTASRESSALNTAGEESPPVGPFVNIYETLDERLEAGEAIAMEAKLMATKRRKIGVTVVQTGIAGQIQIDFAGTIVGWSAIGDASGNLEVSVARAGSSPPDAAPIIPNPTTDKISASAPIAITGAQSASENAAGLVGWDPDLLPWDVVQFNCVTLTGGMNRATLYLLIDEVY